MLIMGINRFFILRNIPKTLLHQFRNGSEFVIHRIENHFTQIHHYTNALQRTDISVCSSSSLNYELIEPCIKV